MAKADRLRGYEQVLSGGYDISTRRKQVVVLGLGSSEKQEKALRNLCSKRSSIVMVAIESILLLPLPITTKPLGPTRHFFLQLLISYSLLSHFLHL